MTAIEYETPAPATHKTWRALLAKREVGVAILLTVTVLLVGTFNHAFFSPENIRDMLVRVVQAVIIGCGVTFVILTGEIDISVGSLLAFLAAFIGLLTNPDHPVVPVGIGIILTLGLGTLVGFINGLLVTYGRIPSIIVTLGMLSILRNVMNMMMGGEWITAMSPVLKFFGLGEVLGVRFCIWTAVVVVIGCSLLATMTPLGRRIYAVGSNPHAAKLAGLSVKRVKIFAFTFSGFLVAVGMLVSVPQLPTIDSGVGLRLELLVVTCVVVGGTSISGGKGTIIGTVLGVALLSIISTVMIFLKLGVNAPFWERAIQGAFILIAVLADHLTQRHGAES
jgi:ribose/xylose/arabinose/galactoside ABC-type transport system permease subunit